MEDFSLGFSLDLAQGDHKGEVLFGTIGLPLYRGNRAGKAVGASLVCDLHSGVLEG